MQGITVTMIETITVARRYGVKRRWIEITPEVNYTLGHAFTAETVGMWLDKDDETADNQIMDAERSIMEDLGLAGHVFTSHLTGI